MGGGTSTPAKQVVQQSNEPWAGAKNYTLELYQRAADALHRTTMDPAPVGYAGPTQPQIDANNMGINWANANMGKGAQLDPVMAMLTEAMGGANSSATRPLPQYQPMPNFNPMNFLTPAASPSFNPKTFDGSTMPFNPQGYAATGYGAMPGFSAQGFGQMPGFDYKATTFNPVGNYGSNVSGQVDQFAGAAPQLGGTDELNAAISAAIDPLQTRLLEDIIPNAKLSGVASGTYNGDASTLDMAKLIRDEFAKPATNIAGQMAYENMARREGLQSQQYMQRYGAGAEATQNSLSRMLQDVMQGRQLTAEQQQQLNQLGLQDVGQQRQLTADEAQMMNQLGLTDVQQLRDLQASQSQMMNQYGFGNTQMMNNLGFQNISQLRDLMTQQQMNNNNLGLQDIINQRGMNLSTADMLNKYGLADMSQLRDLTSQNSQLGNAFNLQAYGLGTDAATKNLTAQTAAGSLWPQLLQSRMQLDTLPMQMLSSLGGEQQGWNQASLDQILKQWQAQQAGPWQGLNEFNAIMQGVPMSQSQVTNTSSSGGGIKGALAGAGGGALLGAGAMSSGLFGAAMAANPATWPILLAAGLGGILGS